MAASSSASKPKVSRQQARDRKATSRQRMTTDLGRDTFLRTRAVGPKTQITYGKIVADFEKFANIQLTPQTRLRLIDPLLEKYITVMFFDGVGIASARYVLAAVAWVCAVPRVAESLPLAKQALRGYARLDPDKSKEPLPWEAASLMSQWLARNGSILAATALLIGFDLYLRPSELLGLKEGHVFPPRGV